VAGVKPQKANRSAERNGFFEKMLELMGIKKSLGRSF
jgi:hypothetical protein